MSSGRIYPRQYSCYGCKDTSQPIHLCHVYFNTQQQEHAPNEALSIPISDRQIVTSNATRTL